MGAGVVVGAVLSAVSAVAAGVVVKVCADDVREWAPKLSAGLVGLAARRLPAVQQERYREEWTGHLRNTPGVLAKVVVAAGLQIAARQIVHGARPCGRIAESRT